MVEETTSEDKLPGNHGRFGEGDATEAYEKLGNHPSPKPSEADAPETAKPGGDDPGASQ